jgi:hypothetical protein
LKKHTRKNEKRDIKVSKNRKETKTAFLKNHEYNKIIQNKKTPPKMHFVLDLSIIVCILGGFLFYSVTAASAAVFIILMIALALACAFLGIGAAYASRARLLGFVDI